MNELRLFPTTIWLERLNLDNNIIMDKCYGLEREQKAVRNSNIGGFQSKSIYHFADPEFDNAPFNDTEFSKAVLGNAPARKDKTPPPLYLESWVNINRTGNSNKKHTHFNNNIYLSGVYYVQVPDKSGNILFHDDRNPLHPYAVDNSYFDDGFEHKYLTPKAGIVLYFPCWVPHSVEVNESPDDRISIGFNIRINEQTVETESKSREM